MKEIPLTKNQIALVDDEDYDFLMQWKWQAKFHKTINSYYAAMTLKIENKSYTILMHRMILNLIDSLRVGDHINHNTLDNRRSNLRIADRSQSNANRRSPKNSSSNFLGVKWCSLNKKWRVRIQSNYKSYNVGLFKNEEEAAKAYDLKATELHGEFANLNFKD